MQDFLQKVNQVAYKETEITGMPLIGHVDLAKEKGIELAKKLGADTGVVEAGTLLMDCMIGQAIKEGRQPEHVQMSLEKTNELLASSDLTEDIKENIRRSVLEHHGVEKFFSLESEIVANADCYRFASVAGFVCALRYLRPTMPFKEVIALISSKVDEKWGIITLQEVRSELSPDYEIIKQLLRSLN